MHGRIRASEPGRHGAERPCEIGGAGTPCDPPVGTLTSPPFKVTDAYFNFLMHGGGAGTFTLLLAARHLGLDLHRTLDVIGASSGQSWIGTERMRRAIDGDTAPRAHMTLLQKDTRLAVEAAAAAGLQGPLGRTVQEVFARASEAGLAELDDAAIFRLLSTGS